MGLVCSSDQSMPQSAGVSPCQRHRMNPHRDCRACQEFMVSRRPEPRGNQFVPRVQQRFPPQMRHQGSPQQPPVGNQPFLHGRSNIPNQVPPRHLNESRVGPIELSPQQGRSSPLVMGGPSPQLMSQTKMGSPYQDLSGAIPATQPQVIQGSTLHSPQQVMPPRVINQEVRMPTIIQTPAQPCSTDVVLQPTQYKEILPAQKVVMPMPEVITAPALPPCPTDMLVREIRNAPQHPQLKTFAQQTTHKRIQPQHQQPRFL